MVAVPVPADAAVDEWDQLGEDVRGAREADWLGSAVAVSDDGLTMVVATHHRNFVDPPAVGARVLDWNGSAWVPRGDDLRAADRDPNSIDLDVGGVAVSADGDVVAVGAPLGVVDGVDTGLVRVFRWTGTGWVQLGGDVVGEGGRDRFGTALALGDDGTTLAVGAPLNEGGGGRRGQVRVFDLDGDVWAMRGTDIDGDPSSGVLGWSLDLSDDGDTLAIPVRAGGGRVRILDWDGAAWVRRGSEIGPAPGARGNGESVALSGRGDTVAIGAPAGDGDVAGHVRVFDWSGAAWVKRGRDLDGVAVGDQAGSSVALSDDGNVVAVGSPSHVGATGDVRFPEGQGRVFAWTGTAWRQRGGDIAGRASSAIGTSIALSGDGTTVVLGGPRWRLRTGLVRAHHLCPSSAVVRVTGDRGGRNGTTHPQAVDRRLGTFFESTHINWQHVTIDLGCQQTVAGLRRHMSVAGGTNGDRGRQGEAVTVSVDGRSWSRLTPSTTTGWESYTAYNGGRAWHSVEFGWSNWLRPTEPLRVRYVRYSWDGHSIGERLHEVDLDPCPAGGPACGAATAPVPDVVGQPEAAALQVLDGFGFVGSVVRQTSATVPAGRVINTWPAAGTVRTEGTRISVRVSAGAPAPRRVTVPNVVGEPVSVATSTLRNAGLQVTVRESGTGDPGFVRSQSPRAGSRVDEGTRVTLTVPASRWPPR
ncbi:MAG: PASTA domain-containing protein [Actinomycetota bacterium]